jgi:outer membrane receptor protein involved in Fe transport
MTFGSFRTVLAGSLSLVALGASQFAHAQDSAGSDGAIIVTASKRGQELRTIPGSVSAITDEQFDALNAQNLSDYITRIPGVVFNDYQPGVSEVVIRGIASTTYHEANQATTGYYLNDIPLIEPGFPLAIPDVDTFDLDRVEVLRGPQGTLFGSSSLGGAINYIVKQADASGFDAGFEGLLSSTRRAGEASYGIKGMVNLPIVADKLALRVVGLERFDAGYLDNTGTGVDGSNDLRVRGLRGSLVFTPTDLTTISAISMFQEYDLDDQTYVLFGPPETFERNTNVPEYQHTEFQLHSLRLEQDLDFATLTALGSYVRKENELAFDDSVFLGIDPRTGTAPLSGSAGTSETRYGELRLASNGEGPFTWLVGANYTKLESAGEDFAFIEGIGTYIDANPGEFGGQPSSVIAPDDFTQRTVNSNDVKEVALFGEASYTFADVFTITGGGRFFEYTSKPRLQFLPNANLVPAFEYEPGAKKESDFIPKVSLTYTPNDRLMVYALYSEGFRLGGINVYSAAVPGLPIDFGSDSTVNYEVGARIDLVPGMVTLDLTGYHVDWKNIQARLFTPVTFNAYTINGGGADVDGVEASLTIRPTDYATFTSNISYNDARLSALLPDSFAPGGGYAKGTRLPGASDWTVSNQLDFTFDDVPFSPRIGFAHRYLSAAPVAFGAVLEKGDFHLFDLNASAEVGQGLELGLFVKNVFNEYGVLNAPFSFAGSVTRPRTVGASLRFALN